MDTSHTRTLANALTASLRTAFEGDEGGGDWYNGLLAAADEVDAETASAPIRRGGPSVASHVEHVRFSLEVARARATGSETRPDWARSWAVTAVAPEAWEGLREAARAEYRAFRDLIESQEGWDEDTLTAAITQVAHVAYHAGAARQAIRAAEARSLKNGIGPR